MSSASPNPQPDQVEELVFHCLEAEDPDQALAELKRAHPLLETRVSKILSRLRAEGLFGAADPLQSVGPIPERLGPFRLIRELGAGGMGIVYLAEQEDLGRQVALKLIRPEQLYFPGARERFRREVEAVARLQHAGIVPVFTVGEEHGLPYFSMEYVGGRSLAEVLRELVGRDPASIGGKDLAACLGKNREPSGSGSDTSSRGEIFEKPWAEVCTALATQIAEALEHAHARGVLHRDVKPSNILITPDGRARLVDFGLARTEGAQQITRSSTQIGSLPYLPPEQLDERTRMPSERQDVYSLGVTMYEMLALRSPFLGPTAEVTRRRIIEGKPPSVRECNGAVSWDLETVCLVAMDPDPAQRYPSANALLLDLDHLRHRRAIEGRRPSLWIRMRRWEQRHPTRTAVAGVGTVLVAVAALLFGLFESAARQQADRLTNQARTAQVEAERRATEASQVQGFLVDLFQYASPDKSLGEDLPISLLLNQGAARIDQELQGQPLVRARMFATFGRVYAWLEEPRKAASFYRRAIASRQQFVAAEHDDEVLTYRHQLARQLIELGNYDEAGLLLDELMGITRARLSGEQGLGYLSLLLRAQGALANVLGDGMQAERLLREALAVQRRNPRATAVSLVQCVNALAAFLQSAHRYTAAQELFDECLRRGVYPDGHPALIALLHHIARNLASLGRYDEARTRASRALVEAERLYGADHPMVARVLRSAAFVERESGQMNPAVQYLERAYAIAEKYQVFSKQYFARMLHDLGVTYHTMGRYAKASDLLQRALTASRAAFAGDHALTGFLSLRLAEALAARNEMTAAEQLARDGLEMLERTGRGQPYHAQALTTVAWIATQMNKLGPARLATEQALAIGERYPAELWIRGRAQAMRALLANLANDGKAAQQAAETASTLYDRVRAGDHPDKALMLYHRAWARLLQRDRPAAEGLFAQSIAMYRRLAPDTDFPDLAWPLNHYGFALLSDRPAEAIPLLEEAWAIRRRILPRGAYWRMVTGLNLGMAYANATEYDKAEPLFLEAHRVVLESYGAGSEFARSSARRLSDLYTKMGRVAEAAKYGADRRPAGGERK